MLKLYKHMPFRFNGSECYKTSAVLSLVFKSICGIFTGDWVLSSYAEIKWLLMLQCNVMQFSPPSFWQWYYWQHFFMLSLYPLQKVGFKVYGIDWYYELFANKEKLLFRGALICRWSFWVVVDSFWMDIPVVVLNFRDMGLLEFVVKVYIHFSENKNTQMHVFYKLLFHRRMHWHIHASLLL